mmetsp:Transcript_55014/g.139776  ORF Transcript_55014/g.139776 Transcript_55014/m.139776 type:complete len:226 (-) Transcript_55014:793-1470(-)
MLAQDPQRTRPALGGGAGNGVGGSNGQFCVQRGPSSAGGTARRRLPRHEPAGGRLCHRRPPLPSRSRDAGPRLARALVSAPCCALWEVQLLGPSEGGELLLHGLPLQPLLVLFGCRARAATCCSSAHGSAAIAARRSLGGVRGGCRGCRRRPWWQVACTKRRHGGRHLDVRPRLVGDPSHRLVPWADATRSRPHRETDEGPPAQTREHGTFRVRDYREQPAVEGR